MWIIYCGKFLKTWEYQTTLPVSWETCMQVKKQQLESHMEEQTGLKLGKEYVKAVYCYSTYLIYMQSTSCEKLGWKWKWSCSVRWTVAYQTPPSKVFYSRVWLFVTPWTVAYQAPPSMGFSRQEYWSGLPFPSPWDLPNPEIELRSPALQADNLPHELPGKP